SPRPTPAVTNAEASSSTSSLSWAYDHRRPVPGAIIAGLFRYRATVRSNPAVEVQWCWQYERRAAESYATKHLSSQAADPVAAPIGPSGSGRTVYSQVRTDSMGDGTAAGRAGRALLLVSRAVRNRAENGHRPVDGRAHVLRCGSGRLSPR